MFEHISKKVLSRPQFLSRLMRAILLGVGMIVISLAFGMAGYRYFFPALDWADAFVNAAMILSGMGPMASPETTGAKIFAGCYAIYSGLILVMSAGVVFAPLLHRFLHKLHADDDDAESTPVPKGKPELLKKPRTKVKHSQGRGFPAIYARRSARMLEFLEVPASKPF